MNENEKQTESDLEMNENGSQLAENVLVDGNSQWNTEQFIEQIWRGLEGEMSIAHIRRVLLEVAPAYDNARVKAFVPILLRRDVLERLHDELKLNP